MEPLNKKVRLKSTTITDLPETLIHHISSYLSLKDLARMSISSKRWRYLCYTTPFFTINLDEFRNASITSLYVGLSFVARMIFRRNKHPLQRFTFVSESYDYNALEYSVETWILSAINCEVQELDLRFGPNFPILPGVIFTLSSLRLLKLDLNGEFLKLPSYVHLPSLESLSLVLVELPDNPLGAWISDGCPSLKTLTLHHCSGFQNLHVNTSSLEILSIDELYDQPIHHLTVSCPNLNTLNLELVSPYSNETSFTLYAPNLQSLTWFGRIVNQFHSSTPTSLHSASITIPPSYSEKDSTREVLFGFWKALLAHMKSVKCLSVCSFSMLTIASILMLKPSLSLSNTEYLKLSTHLSDFETCMIVLLFRRSPDLKTLVITQEKHYNVKLKSQPELVQPFRDTEFAHNLKMAEMRLLGSGENNLELVKYLLKNAKQLARITIRYSHSEFDLAKKIGQNLPLSSVGIHIVPI